MSGHSKWSTIKRKKGAADQKRGKIFTRCIHEITTAVREGGGGDPNSNSRLRLAMDKARSANMPSENIERAIKRATGEIKGEEQAELTYEGYGPGGIAIIVQVLTNNKNRTVGEIRHAFSRAGGTLGENGCVNWMFSKKGIIIAPKDAINEEVLMELALDNGASDVTDQGEVWEIICEPADFSSLKTAVEQKVKLEAAEISMTPMSYVKVEGKEQESLLKLIDALDDLDDVIEVSSNADFSE
ncbi:MAG: YebC/PmpR family DNA-binding transcriptional regulator [Deltaproteobacteria bacterium]|nr:YebC/PmpR family DNA-binding transcriptional regulator [Deltaproteobacteria bacterium]